MWRFKSNELLLICKLVLYSHFLSYLHPIKKHNKLKVHKLRNGERTIVSHISFLILIWTSYLKKKNHSFLDKKNCNLVDSYFVDEWSMIVTKQYNNTY